MSVAFERIAAAMGSMCEQEERRVNDELAPVLRDDPQECGEQLHRLAHATLAELADGAGTGAHGGGARDLRRDRVRALDGHPDRLPARAGGRARADHGLVSRLVVVPLAIVASLGPLAPDSAAAPLRPAVASWYGPSLWGNQLGCGGILRAWTEGVAHKTLRCGTSVRVCSRRCRTTRVVDRGPYVPGREFDLTAAFARRIGFAGVGIVYVRTAG